MRSSAFEHRDCPGCGSRRCAIDVSSKPAAERLSIEELRPFWAGFHDRRAFFSYHRCQDCGLLFAPTFFADDQLAELYSNLAPNMDMVPSSAIAATQRGYLEVAARQASLDGGYLEIGPDVGYIAADAARAGRFDHFWLFEPNRAVHGQLAGAVAPHPCSIFAEMVDLSPVPDGSIGLAVMIQVLDHLLDPVGILREIRRKLRPDGTLMIVTHNEQSLMRKVLGRRWPAFCLQHPHVFNPDTIGDMLRRTGYPNVKVERTTNYFPIDFLVWQAGLAMGVKLNRLPLPKASIGLKLGNIITMARLS
jgi:SAM-dependent methyltransferase